MGIANDFIPDNNLFILDSTTGSVKHSSTYVHRSTYGKMFELSSNAGKLRGAVVYWFEHPTVNREDGGSILPAAISKLVQFHSP